MAGMTKVKRFNSTQPLASVTGGHWVKASDYDAIAAKLVEVEVGRDHWETVAIARQAKQHAAEARIAHLENHIEAVAKDTHKIMVAYEAAPTRCAECDCEKGGADCNWIATPNPLDDLRVKALPKPSVAEWPYWTVCPKVLEEIRQDAGEWAGEAYLQTVEAIALAVVRRIDALSALEENK